MVTSDAHGAAGEQAPVDLPGVLSRLIAGGDLNEAESRRCIATVLAGDMTPVALSALLVALRCKGETPEEVAGAVDAMLGACTPLELDRDRVIDLVGTGGSPRRRERALNVSTLASFVAAAAGAVVCKHGNRKASSTSGSTDVLEALGLAVEVDPPTVARCVSEVGVGFAFARVFHPAMRHAGPVRAELGVPTIFNLLGPLSHPARVRRGVIGVGDPERVHLVAEALARRGVDHMWVVHGSDGLDELTVCGPTAVVEVTGHELRTLTVSPTELGLGVREPAELGGGDAAANAVIAARVFSGEEGAEADIVALNAAAGLVVAGVADDLPAGLEAARVALSEGRAAEVVESLRRLIPA